MIYFTGYVMKQWDSKVLGFYLLISVEYSTIQITSIYRIQLILVIFVSHLEMEIVSYYSDDCGFYSMWTVTFKYNLKY